MKYANGNSYEGEWYKSQREGYGIEKFADGSSFEGEWYYN